MPKLVIGDGALGFWKAIRKCYPESRHQCCWVYKMARVPNVVPKLVQSKMKVSLQDIWMAETRFLTSIFSMQTSSGLSVFVSEVNEIGNDIYNLVWRH